MHLIMSIKTFRRVVLVHSFEQRFENDAFGRVRDVLHCGNELYPVLFQGVLMDSHFILISRKPVELIDYNIFLWTVLIIRF